MKFGFKFSQFFGYVLLVCSLLASSQASAQTCGIVNNSISVTNTNTVIDPFNPVGARIDFQYTLTRYRINTGSRTEYINFGFKDATTTNSPLVGSQIYITSIVATGGATTGTSYNVGSVSSTSDIFYESTETFPATPPTSSAVNNMVTYVWPEASTGDQILITGYMLVSTNTTYQNIANGSYPLTFYYNCKAAGNLNDATGGTATSLLNPTFTVRSGLQAYNSGATSINFGDVTKVAVDGTTPSAAYDPLPVVQGLTAPNINVNSSGPYTIAMTSTNNYQLKLSSIDTLNYGLEFMGQTNIGRTAYNSATFNAFTTRTCQRKISGNLIASDYPMIARLREGGKAIGALPAKAIGTYTDTLTVTVTPLATPDTGSTTAVVCTP